MSARRQAPGPRRRQHEILDAAAEVFYQRGYAASTVRDVAELLGILKGSLYYYIDTKEDLLFALLSGVQDDVESIRLEVAARRDLEPLERLEDYVRRQAEYNIRNLRRITVFIHDLDRLSEPRRLNIEARRRVHHEYVEGLIRQAQVRGQADPDLDATIMRHCVFASIVWTYRWYRQSGPAQPGEVADLCARFALRGLRAIPPIPAQRVPGMSLATGGHE
jgi:AcrR family transcriptional regulator